ncbi:MAG: SRPBCC family protein [Methylotetracoccus sp.]|jgi:ribosome-associated toxin RatA of RatAB toxin-antitoxin module|nr:SRPBCC family protein [Methylotetracoccus sp.]
MKYLKLCAASLLALTAAAAIPSALANLEPGEPVVRVTAAEGPIDGQVEATMVVPAPAAAVYSALTECARAPEVFPSLKSCRVIETDPGRAWDIREHKVASWASFLPDMSTVFRSEYVPNRSISFRLLSGDLQHLDGAWRLEPVKGGTRVTYEARVGFHALVPSFLVRQSLAGDVPKFMAAIRDESVRRAPRFADGKS